MVARQIMTNAMKQGEQIDFVVLYGYQFSNRCYKVFLSEFHSGKPPKYNLPKIASILGQREDRNRKRRRRIKIYW